VLANTVLPEMNEAAYILMHLELYVSECDEGFTVAIVPKGDQFDLITVNDHKALKALDGEIYEFILPIRHNQATKTPRRLEIVMLMGGDLEAVFAVQGRANYAGKRCFICNLPSSQSWKSKACVGMTFTTDILLEEAEKKVGIHYRPRRENEDQT
jgi:hypothetical protein